MTDTLNIFVIRDTVQKDWTGDASIVAVQSGHWVESSPPPITDTILAYPPFLSVDGMRITLPFGEGAGMPSERVFLHYDLPFWVLLACISMMALLRFAYPRRMKQLVSSLAGERFLHTVMREGNLFEERLSLGLTTVFAATTALFLKEIAGVYFHLTLPWAPDWVVWLLLMFGVLFWWSIKAIFIRLVGVVFGTQEATVLYLVRNLTYTLVQGMALAVLLPLHYYGGWPFVLPALLGLLLLMHTYRIFRNVISGITDSGYSVGYQILFVITIEILPLAILAKFLAGMLS